MWAVWIALLLWATPTQGVSTHCEIPAVEKLQNTSLTCKFSEDISKLRQDFKVQYYKSNTTDSTEVILDCYWLDNKPECTVHKCCQYDGNVTETLTLRVLSVTEAQVGRYVCFVLPAAPDSYNFCNFTLTEKQTGTPGSNPAAIAVPIVIVIAIIICIIIIVWRLKCSKKAEDKMMKKKTCHFWPVQRYSREKETLDGKFNEVKQSLIESNVEENDSRQSTNIPDLKERSTEKDLKSTNVTTAEKFGQKSDDTNGSHRPVHTSIIGRIRTFFGHETKPQEIEKGQTDVDKTNVSDVSNEKALNKQALSESGANVSSSAENETVTQSQKMQHPSDQNDVNTPIAEQQSDDGTGTRMETCQTLGENELQTENETKDQNRGDEDKYTSDITKEGRKAKSVKKNAMKKEKGAQEKAEKKIKSAREKAEHEKKLVKENAEKEEATVKRKAEELEKIAKEKAEKEEKMASKKGKEEEKIAKDKAKKEEEIAKRTSKKMTNTTANIEETVNKISNEKDEQMQKISKSKDEQIEIIAKEKAKQLEKIAKEKEEELKKIANARDKRLQEIAKRTAEETEIIKRKKEEEIQKVRKVKRERMQTIISKKEKKTETINKNEEDQRKKKGKDDVQRSDKQLKIKGIEDGANEDEQAKETDPCLDTNNSNVQVNPATRSQGKPHTIIQMNEPASHQDTLEAPTGTQGQTLQAVDKIVTPVKKNNEDKASKRNASTEDKCTVS